MISDYCQELIMVQKKGLKTQSFLYLTNLIIQIYSESLAALTFTPGPMVVVRTTDFK